MDSIKFYSKYFKPYEFFYSKTAHEKNIFNCPTDWKVFENVHKLATHLDKIRDLYGGSVYISSAFRTQTLNRAITGSSTTSYHLSGRAADIYSGNFDRLRDVVFNYTGFSYIKGIKHYENDDFEVIVYSDRNFIHFAFKK